MKKYTLKRVVMTDELTQGVLCADGHALCVTLERPWMDNKTDISCIPEGTYKCVPDPTGGKYENVWEIKDVPNRSDILFHAGNYVHNSKGCILVGRSFNAGTISSSRNALDYLRSTLPDEFELEVINV